MIIPPDKCPSCQSVLEWKNDQLYCLNGECPAKAGKQVEHFAKTLKIKGLGPAAIEKLDLSSISEIYTMDLDFMSRQLKSEKLAIKLHDEIERSKQEALDTVLPAFGIPLVGRSATEKLSKTVENIFEIDAESCKRAGLGNVATTNLMNWLDNDFERYCDLPFSFEFKNNTTTTSVKAVVCISGKLKSFKTKAEATKALEESGYIVKDSLTKDVSYLVNESGTQSAKTVKAEQLGVTIINNLTELLEI